MDLGGSVAIALLGAACLALAALAFWLWRSRVQALKQFTEKDADKDLENMLSQVAYTPAAAPKPVKGIAESKEMAFVVTDIEGSTQLSVAGRDVYDQLLAIHDQLMREGIAKFNGTQIVTEGDSFLVAFHTVAEAVAFCQDLQYKMLDTPWPRAVLRLPGCEPVTNADGDVVMQGPRVRMGVHWALPGLVACRPHALTKAPMMVGIAVVIAQEISDAAQGGQILLSQDAWEQLRGHMPSASFPVVQRLGLFRVQAEEGKPSWIYTVQCSLLRPVPREMPPPRKLEQAWPPPGATMQNGWGLYVVDPPLPLPNSADALTFVSLRLRLPPRKRSKRRRYSAHTRHTRDHHQVPVGVLFGMQQLLVKQAQQFEGYMFDSDTLTERKGYFSFAFADTCNALRFCHTVQVVLMYNRWPSEADEYAGQTVVGIDGRLVFKGPRLASAIHRGSDYDLKPLGSYHPTAAPGADYSGPSVALARALADSAHGGQVLMTEEAWQGVQDMLQAFPSALYSINLGLHVVSPEFPRPRYLMEVMPTLLSGRTFKPPNTQQQLELGYREAPSVHEPMTILFSKVAKPADVARAEASAAGLGEDQVLSSITAYQLAVGQYAALARSLLPAYGGYECKEPEPGKFTMAFGYLTDAIAWASHVQKELLQLDWPPELLAMEGCQELRGEQGQRLWRGLRIRMGMAYGYINVKKPMNTGRADYFGELANTAARVAALAAPGQILIESSQVDVTMPDGTLLLSEEFATYLPVKWASKDGLSPRRSEVHVSEGRPGHMSAGGASPIVMGRRAQGQGGQVRRASYSSPAAEAPLSLPFQRATRAAGASSEQAHSGALLPSVQSKQRMSLLEVTSRSLSLGAQQLLAMRHKPRTASGGGAELGGSMGGADVEPALPVMEHIQLRALGRFLLRGLDNPKVLYQALPDTLMERTFPIPSEAMVSMPDPSTSMLAEAQRRGGLFDLLRRTAGHIGAVGTGLTRASVAIVGVGKSGGGRRKVAAEELMLRNKRRLEGSVGTSTDTEFLGIPRATLRHTSDLANRVAQQLPSSLLRTARHHSSTMERMSHRQLGVELLAAGRHVPGREVPRTQRLTACLSIPPDRSRNAAGYLVSMQRSRTLPRDAELQEQASAVLSTFEASDGESHQGVPYEPASPQHCSEPEQTRRSAPAGHGRRRSEHEYVQVITGSHDRIDLPQAPMLAPLRHHDDAPHAPRLTSYTPAEAAVLTTVVSTVEGVAHRRGSASFYNPRATGCTSILSEQFFHNPASVANSSPVGSVAASAASINSPRSRAALAPPVSLAGRYHSPGGSPGSVNSTPGGSVAGAGSTTMHTVAQGYASTLGSLVAARTGSPFRDRNPRMPSPLGGLDSFSTARRGPSLLGPHYQLHAQQQDEPARGDAAKATQLPAPRELASEIESAAASPTPSITVGLRGGMSSSGLAVPERLMKGTVAAKQQNLTQQAPRAKDLSTRGPSIKNILLETLSMLRRKASPSPGSSPAEKRKADEADSFSAVSSPTATSAAGGLGHGPAATPGHTGPLDLRVRAVLRAANAQVGELASRDASATDSALHSAAEILQQAGGSIQGPGSASQVAADPSDVSSAALQGANGVSQLASPTQPQRSSQSMWHMLKVLRHRRTRRSSDTILELGRPTSAIKYTPTTSPTSRCRTNMDQPSRTRASNSAMRSSASVTYPASHGMNLAPLSPPDVSAQISGEQSPSVSSPARPSNTGEPAALRQSTREKKDRALANVLRGVRVARALRQGQLSQGSGVTAGGAGLVYSPPGRLRDSVDSPGRRSHTSSASSIYSGTASPRMTMSGAEQSASGTVSSLLANVFGRTATSRRSNQPPPSLSSRHRRRSAHIVLSEAGRLELLQRSAATAAPSVDPALAEPGVSSPTFAAAVARTYVEHRRQQQQRASGAVSGLPDSVDGSNAAVAGDRASSTEGTAYPAPGESFSHGTAPATAAYQMHSRMGSSALSSQLLPDRASPQAAAVGPVISASGLGLSATFSPLNTIPDNLVLTHGNTEPFRRLSSGPVPGTPCIGALAVSLLQVSSARSTQYPPGDPARATDQMFSLEEMGGWMFGHTSDNPNAAAAIGELTLGPSVGSNPSPSPGQVTWEPLRSQAELAEPSPHGTSPRARGVGGPISPRLLAMGTMDGRSASARPSGTDGVQAGAVSGSGWQTSQGTRHLGTQATPFLSAANLHATMFISTVGSDLLSAAHNRDVNSQQPLPTMQSPVGQTATATLSRTLPPMPQLPSPEGAPHSGGVVLLDQQSSYSSAFQGYSSSSLLPLAPGPLGGPWGSGTAPPYPSSNTATLSQPLPPHSQGPSRVPSSTLSTVAPTIPSETPRVIPVWTLDAADGHPPSSLSRHQDSGSIDGPVPSSASSTLAAGLQQGSSAFPAASRSAFASSPSIPVLTDQPSASEQARAGMRPSFSPSGSTRITGPLTPAGHSGPLPAASTASPGKRDGDGPTRSLPYASISSAYGNQRGPRRVEPALPGPSHPLYYNTPVSEWAEPEALAAVAAAAAEVSNAQAAANSGKKHGFGSRKKSTRAMSSVQAAALVSPTASPTAPGPRAPSPPLSGLSTVTSPADAVARLLSNERTSAPAGSGATNLSRLGSAAAFMRQHEQEQASLAAHRYPTAPGGTTASLQPDRLAQASAGSPAKTHGPPQKSRTSSYLLASPHPCPLESRSSPSEHGTSATPAAQGDNSPTAQRAVRSPPSGSPTPHHPYPLAGSRASPAQSPTAIGAQAASLGRPSPSLSPPAPATLPGLPQPPRISEAMIAPGAAVGSRPEAPLRCGPAGQELESAPFHMVHHPGSLPDGAEAQAVQAFIERASNELLARLTKATTMKEVNALMQLLNAPAPDGPGVSPRPSSPTLASIGSVDDDVSPRASSGRHTSTSVGSRFTLRPPMRVAIPEHPTSTSFARRSSGASPLSSVLLTSPGEARATTDSGEPLSSPFASAHAISDDLTRYTHHPAWPSTQPSARLSTSATTSPSDRTPPVSGGLSSGPFGAPTISSAASQAVRNAYQHTFESLASPGFTHRGSTSLATVAESAPATSPRHSVGSLHTEASASTLGEASAVSLQGDNPNCQQLPTTATASSEPALAMLRQDGPPPSATPISDQSAPEVLATDDSSHDSFANPDVSLWSTRSGLRLTTAHACTGSAALSSSDAPNSAVLATFSSPHVHRSDGGAPAAGSGGGAVSGTTSPSLHDSAALSGHLPPYLQEPESAFGSPLPSLNITNSGNMRMLCSAGSTSSQGGAAGQQSPGSVSLSQLLSTGAGLSTHTSSPLSAARRLSHLRPTGSNCARYSVSQGGSATLDAVSIADGIGGSPQSLELCSAAEALEQFESGPNLGRTSVLVRASGAHGAAGGCSSTTSLVFDAHTGPQGEVASGASSHVLGASSADTTQHRLSLDHSTDGPLEAAPGALEGLRGQQQEQQQGHLGDSEEVERRDEAVGQWVLGGELFPGSMLDLAVGNVAAAAAAGESTLSVPPVAVHGHGQATDLDRPGTQGQGQQLREDGSGPVSNASSSEGTARIHPIPHPHPEPHAAVGLQPLASGDLVLDSTSHSSRQLHATSSFDYDRPSHASVTFSDRVSAFSLHSMTDRNSFSTAAPSLSVGGPSSLSLHGQASPSGYDMAAAGSQGRALMRSHLSLTKTSFEPGSSLASHLGHLAYSPFSPTDSNRSGSSGPGAAAMSAMYGKQRSQSHSIRTMPYNAASDLEHAGSALSVSSINEELPPALSGAVMRGGNAGGMSGVGGGLLSLGMAAVLEGDTEAEGPASGPGVALPESRAAAAAPAAAGGGSQGLGVGEEVR